MVAPCLCKLLDPKQEPVLRGTALALVDALLASDGFAASAEMDAWAEIFFTVMLVPNLVWRAGRAAEHVRHAAMGGLAKLVPLRALTPAQLQAQVAETLPVIYTAADDDNAETRRLGCAVLDGILAKLGPSRLGSEEARKLYPELLKRLDDASDGVRIAACAPMVSLFRAMNYSAVWNEGANFDKANYQYFLRGILVHLDDPSPEIQGAISGVLKVGMAVDAPTFLAEVSKVRDHHRSTRPCDELIEAAQALAGQIV